VSEICDKSDLSQAAALFQTQRYMKAIEAFNSLPATPQEIAEFSRQIIDDLNQGEIEPLKFKIFLKGLETVMDNVKPVLDELAREEAEKYGTKSFELMGAMIELREVGTKYDYTNCGYSRLQHVTTEMESWAAQKKEAEKFLQSLKGSMTVVNELTGEIETVHPPVKSSKSAMAITLPKMVSREIAEKTGGSNE
jgi:hypothetical protein